MNANRISAKRLAGFVSVVLLVVALSSFSVVAYEPQDTDMQPAAVAADDGTVEVGVEWVVDYPPGWNDLPATAPDALGLYNRLGAAGWTRRFAFGNGLAWEQDWKGLNKPGGGTEHIWIDTVDLAYFAGHGNSSGIFFGVGGNTKDDQQLTYNDCRLEWGNGDAEWVGLAACNVLADAHLRDWAWCMNRLHLILGFVTTMADVPHGEWFGNYINQGYNMTQAWFRASDALQPQGKIARVLAEEQIHFYDHWWNHVGGDTWDNDYYWWDHHVGSEPARPVNIGALAGAMPVFRTAPLSLAEATAKWGDLGTAFGVTTTSATGLPLMANQSQSDPVWTSPDKQLEMDPSGGLFAFTNLNRLWTTPTVNLLGTASPVYALAPQDAITVANNFLTANGLKPGDAQFYEVVADTVSTYVSPTVGAGRLSVGQVSQTSAYQVIYSRILTYTSPAGAQDGPQAVQEFSVIGPGAKLKVFVDPMAGAGFGPAADTGVIGGVGGWRRLGQPGLAPQAVMTVPVLDYGTQIVPLFNKLEPIVALSYIPLNFTSRTVLSYTVAYYEYSIGQGQQDLVPAYVLNTQYNLDNGDVVTSPVYIPANPVYMAPLALITPTVQLPTQVRSGQQIVFQAADAAATLASLGFDAALNFKLGNGSLDYDYKWYVDSVAPANQIGSGMVMTYTARSTATESDRITQNIILQVTDTGSPEVLKSVATYQLTVVPPVYLPVVIR